MTFLLFSFAFGQKIKVDGYNRSFEKYRNSGRFDYVHEDFDSTQLTWVADMTIRFDTVIPGMLGECYKLLKAKSSRFGANSFRVKDSDIYSEGPDKYISISTYWLRMEDRDTNQTLLKSPKVYLFGFLGFHEEIEGYEVSLNDEEFIMTALSFRQDSFSPGDVVNIQLGSKMRGTSISVGIRDNMLPKFYYFHMIRGSFKNSSIKEYDLNYGLFLSRILAEK